jgi:hypothetical protein
VREQGALQGDDRPAGVQRLGDPWGEDGSGGKAGREGMHPVIMDATFPPASRECP